MQDDNPFSDWDDTSNLQDNTADDGINYEWETADESGLQGTNSGGGGGRTWLWIVLGGVAGLCVCAAVISGVFLFVAGSVPEISRELEPLLATQDAAQATAAPRTSRGGEPTATPIPVETAVSEEAVDVDPTEPNPLVGQPLYVAKFNRPGFWATGAITGTDGTREVEAEVVDGVYRFTVNVGEGLYWATAGEEEFGDGVYELETTAVKGAETAGFGMLFFVDEVSDDFYIFEVSADGFIWIGKCESGCESIDVFVDEGWFASEIVNAGLGATNHLRVEVQDGTMTFTLNGEDVGKIQDRSLRPGDIGLLVETFAEGGVTVEFDNFNYTPFE